MAGGLRRGASLLLLGTLQIATPAAAAVGQPGLPGIPAIRQDGLNLTGSFETLYDSNVVRSSGLNMQGHRDDFRYSPAVSATYGRSGGALTLAVDALIGRDIFQYHDYLNSNRYVGGGSLTYRRGTSCQASINGNYSRRQNGIRSPGAEITDPSGLPVEDVGTVINNVQSSSVYGANLGCGSPAGRLSFGGGYSHSSLNNESATRRFLNSESDVFSGNVGIGILRPGQLSLVGSYSTISYPNRLAVIGGVVIPPQLINSGVHTYRIGLSFSRPIGTRLSGTIGASYLHADPTGGQQPYTSPAYNASLTYIASPRLRFELVGLRDIVASTTSGALYRVIDQVEFTTSYSLGQSISIRANAGLISNNYKQPFVIPGEVLRVSQTTKEIGAGITFAPRDLYDVTFNVSQSFRTANPGVLNYNSTRAGITLAVHI